MMQITPTQIAQQLRGLPAAQTHRICGIMVTRIGGKYHIEGSEQPTNKAGAVAIILDHLNSE